jgi:hypothetical protein
MTVPKALLDGGREAAAFAEVAAATAPSAGTGNWQNERMA